MKSGHSALLHSYYYYYLRRLVTTACWTSAHSVAALVVDSIQIVVVACGSIRSQQVCAYPSGVHADSGKMAIVERSANHVE